MPLILTEEYALMAAAVVERSFPPRDQDGVYRVLAALNLLNAAVKTPWGKRLTSYTYIKGMAACLFIRLLYHPVEGVSIFWDSAGQVAYFRVADRQFSFHYVPLLHSYANVMVERGLRCQKWDGARLQEVAASLFLDAMTERVEVSGDEQQRLIALMTRFTLRDTRGRVRRLCDAGEMPEYKQPRRRVGPKSGKGLPNRLYNLRLALMFNGADRDGYELRRYHDTWRVRVMRYTGRNYMEMVNTLSYDKPKSTCKPEHLLEVGAYYCLRRSNWQWMKVSYNRFLLLRAYYGNIYVKKKTYNLCITYRIARYLSLLFPNLRFVNVLNFTRMSIHRRYYTSRMLAKVPLGSLSRVLKVWMVVDKRRDLRFFDIRKLPEVLFREYEETPDYHDFFRKVFKRGCVGLKAYSRFHLLPAIYDRVEIYGRYARVRNHCGKWAIYSLLREKFVSDFLYDSIWYDHNCYAIFGTINNRIIIIHQMGVPRR